MSRIEKWIKIIFEQDNKLKFIISRILMRTGLSSLIRINRGGYSLRFYPSALSASLWVNREGRDDDELFLENVLKEGDTFIDIGANIGTLSLKASTLVGEGKVYSFEPHPNTFKYLEGNIALNSFSNISAFNVGLGEKQGVLRFTDNRSDDQNSVSEDGDIEVTINTLDQYEISDISLLKLDVEGFEKFVLEGAKSTLAKTKVLYNESWESHFNKFSYCTGDVIKLLNEAGFSVFRFSDMRLHAVDSHYVSEDCENLISIKDVDDFISKTSYKI